MAEAKAAEAASPPPHGESGSQLPPPPPPQPTQHRPTSSIPMFVSARQSLYGPCPVEMDCPHCQLTDRTAKHFGCQNSTLAIALVALLLVYTPGTYRITH
ncbi:hypothetical protein ANCCEY_05729 [Ancylostoma ceylanicum]|uniref:LITAF domain-containing protein n=1 Tax=Ancylostoma ceylanicum TaxID=53326 RepID=A0A0D6LVE1_9BILA|nr:hypothetical protein ANCCEY_05729 [Ancylostoma ceylanicum]